MQSGKILILDFIRNLRQIFTVEEKDNKISQGKSLWKKVRVWIMFLFGLSIFIFLLSRISIRDLILVLSNVNAGYFIIAFILGISATIFKTIRFGYFFPPAPERRLNLYGTFSFLRFIYYLLPFNSGELVYLGVLKKYRFTPTIAETAPTWIFLRLSDIIAITIWFSVSLSFTNISGDLYGRMYSFRWIIISISLILVILIFTFPFWIPKISFKISNNWLDQRIKVLKSGFTRTYGVKVLLRTVLIGMLIWLILITSQVFAQFAFNTPLGFSQAVLVSITIYCISLIPINTPLNIGTDEAAWTGAMTLAGVDFNKAISIAISIRIITMLVLFTDGLFGLLILMLRRNYNQMKTSTLQNE